MRTTVFHASWLSPRDSLTLWVIIYYTTRKLILAKDPLTHILSNSLFFILSLSIIPLRGWRQLQGTRFLWAQPMPFQLQVTYLYVCMLATYMYLIQEFIGPTQWIYFDLSPWFPIPRMNSSSLVQINIRTCTKNPPIFIICTYLLGLPFHLDGKSAWIIILMKLFSSTTYHVRAAQVVFLCAHSSRK